MSIGTMGASPLLDILMRGGIFSTKEINYEGLPIKRIDIIDTAGTITGAAIPGVQNFSLTFIPNSPTAWRYHVCIYVERRLIPENSTRNKAIKVKLAERKKQFKDLKMAIDQLEGENKNLEGYINYCTGVIKHHAIVSRHRSSI